MKISRYLLLFAAALFIAFSAENADAQSRDFLSDKEIDIIQEAQDIDSRVDVLIKMADRRFAALNAGEGAWAPSKKEVDKWGEIPSGSRLELLDDIKRILQKAIDDIDNLYAHPDSAPIRDPEDRKGKKRDPQRFGIAVKQLAAASNRYVVPLKKFYDAAEDDRERGVISDALGSCEQIIEAAATL